MKHLLLKAFIFLIAGTSWGQSSLSLSAAMIRGNVKVKENWIPATGPGRKAYRTGSSTSSDIYIHYSFRPRAIIKNKNIWVDIGSGYFFQRFDVKRPFNYRSTAEIIFNTDHYSYLCYHGNVGLTYSNTFNSKKYFMTYNVTYRILKSFQQNYTPRYSTGTEGFITQRERLQINFGNMISLSIGLNRRLGNRFSIGANVIAPVYTRWRNDEIFNDDPATFFKPKFSLGASLSVSYNFKSKEHLKS
ncbi:MAG TPA: hypothetical protein VD884_08175 [Ohtaekwangia sp.]|nr:hypothetical protein [Ohtaekwangia sp.]